MGSWYQDAKEKLVFFNEVSLCVLAILKDSPRPAVEDQHKKKKFNGNFVDILSQTAWFGLFFLSCWSLVCLYVMVSDLEYLWFVCVCCLLFVFVCFLKRENEGARSCVSGEVERISELGKGNSMLRIYCMLFYFHVFQFKINKAEIKKFLMIKLKAGHIVIYITFYYCVAQSKR